MAFFFSSNPLPFLLLLLLLLCPAASSAGNATATLTDVLTFFNMPPGLFPDNVTSFSLDVSSGALRVNISGGGCYIPPDYKFYFDPSVTGRLWYNSLDGITGIQTPRYWYFGWHDVDIIQVDLDPARYIYFVTSKFTTIRPVAQFFTIRPCVPHVPHVFQSFRLTKECSGFIQQVDVHCS